MMTEDELRDRLRTEAAGVQPQGDLIESLARGHARRHRRARAGLAAGSLAATGLVVALMAGLFTSGTTLPVDTASQSDKQIIERAKAAYAATDNMIMNVNTTHSLGLHNGWVLRSEKQARMVLPGVADTTFKPPGVREEISYRDKIVITLPESIEDIVSVVTGSGTGDFAPMLNDRTLTVRSTGDEIHLTVERFGITMDIWLDPKTALPVRAKFDSYSMTFAWFPATEQNRKLLEHVVPPDFEKRTDYPSAILPGVGTPLPGTAGVLQPSR
jgi:hypothetical protein